MIEIQNLNKTYDKRSRHSNHVLRDISLTLPDTGFVCIVGVSGCGKTSLLNAVGGLDTFDSGTISTGKVTVSKSGSRRYEQERNSSFSYIFQNYYLLSGHSVAYNVYLGLHSLQLSHREKLARVKQSLEAVNMARYSRRSVGELSGGQQQRVAIARALARRPRVIFADEPTGNLDEENTINICTLLRQISKTSLVVMVTHEEKIARFFADRIITLGDGKIMEDSDSWNRNALTADSGNTLYAGDYQSQSLASMSAKIRILSEEGAAPVNLTIAILKNKIIIKTDDNRSLSCSAPGEAPVVKEGKSPVVTLESMDNDHDPLKGGVLAEADIPAKPGKGLPFSMMLQEAVWLQRSKGIRHITARFFLVLMSVLTIWIVGDYITVSSIDFKDFASSDSHILALHMEQGQDLNPYVYHNVYPIVPMFINDLKTSDADYDIIPYVTAQASLSLNTFAQLGAVSMELHNLSYVPIEKLDESTLIYGRMPENCCEIVIDRWVLENAFEKEGITQNVLGDISQLLGKKLNFFKKNYCPTIVGICDSNESSAYLPWEALCSLANSSTEIITLSNLQSMFPEKYDHITLSDEECIVITNNAGIAYAQKIGSNFNTNSNAGFQIVDTFEEEIYASIVISDSALEKVLDSMNQKTSVIYFYTPDKPALVQAISDVYNYADIQEARKTFATAEGEGYNGIMIYHIRDTYEDSLNAYTKATSLKADARIIVTVTMIVLSMIMLYLFQRSYVQQRIGMMAVYRLLGLPRRKLIGIFTIESFILSLLSVLPATLLTYIIVAILNWQTELEFSMLLPWSACLVTCVAIIAYYILVSLLPVCRLLRLPPARLAAKYDI